MNTDRISIDTTLPLEEVQWSRVLDVLQSRYRLSFVKSAESVRNFIRNFEHLLEVSWFKKGKLTADEYRIVVGICSIYSADSVTLVRKKSFSPLGRSIVYQQSVRFVPNLRGGDSGPSLSTVSAVYQIWLGKSLITLSSKLSVVLTRLGLLLGSSLVYVLSVGFLLYGFSVFLLFLELPVEVVSTATRNGQIGIALLVFLIGFAGLAGTFLSSLLLHLFRRSSKAD